MTATTIPSDPPPAGPDPLDAGRVLGLGDAGLLGAFNRAGVLAPADVHVALRLARLGGDTDETVALAAALAVRGPRVGHVHVDLASVRATVASEAEEDVDLDALPWPDAGPWVDRLAGSPLVAAGPGGPEERPLRLVGTVVYLDRYWRDEGAVAADIRSRAAAPPPEVDPRVLAEGLDRLVGDDGGGEQRWAAAAAVLRRLAVIAGGPGTGKTTTVARALGLLEEQAAARGSRPPLVALAAPTGKAAARLAEAVRAEAAAMDVDGAVRARLAALDSATIHRLLVRHPGNASRFRHDRHNRLPHDVVVVDETSMVPLGLMARLAEAVRPDARLILVGDPRQLASVEAGAVLGDIVGPAGDGMRMSREGAAELSSVTGATPPGAVVATARPGAIGDAVVLLRANHRFRGTLAALADAVRSGDADRALDALAAHQADGDTDDDALRWLPVDASTAEPALLEPLHTAVCTSGAALVAAARAGDGAAAVAELGRFRVLCAHRRGPAGVSTWNRRLEEWLGSVIDGFSADGAWYVGRPVMVTANDYGLRLFNGDTGAVVWRPGGGVAAVFDRGGAPVVVSPSRLSDVDTVWAMTVHKAQGSEFDEVAVVLPEPSSRVLTRELLYTALTRARRRITVVGTEDAVRAAVGRPIARASGLTARLWT